MASVDFRSIVVAVPAYELFWDDFDLYGVIQPGVSDDASDG